MRMDVYRLVHGKSFWIFLAIIVGTAALATGMMSVVTSPEFMQSMQSASDVAARSGFKLSITSSPGGLDAGDYADVDAALAMLSGGITQIAYIGRLFLNGGALTVMFAIFLSIFLASEFETGFSKNVFTVQPNRLAFLGARVVEIVVLAAVFVAVALAASLASAAVFGLDLAPTPLPDFLLWGVLVTFVTAGFGMLTALFVWLTRKMAVGIVAGVLLSTGLVTSIIQGILLLFPNLKHLADFTLSSCMASLGQGLDVAGGLSSVHVAVVGLAFIVLGAVLSAVALQKKDI